MRDCYRNQKFIPPPDSLKVTDMDTRRCRCGVAVVRGRVYAVGGFNGALRVRTVDEYDPTKDKWASVASMDAR